MYLPRLATSDLQDRDKVQVWTDSLGEAMASYSNSQMQYHFDITEDAERHLFYPTVAEIHHGVSHEFIFTHDFFQSRDYLEFTEFGASIVDLVDEDGLVEKGERSEQVSSLEAALKWLQSEALRGLSRQRYKGLGEMNPDQLWETTMDPKRRSMLRVTIEDAIAADHMFNTLMGDQVEPRKDFIVSNALKVANLDV